MEAMQLNELLKVLGIGLTPATVSLVGYFLYRSLVSELISAKKEVKDMKEEMETAYVRRDLNEERTHRLEGDITDLQRQIDTLQRWRDRHDGHD